MDQACTFILFGATGDLARKKLIPALYMLLKKKSQTFHLIGAAQENITVDTMIEQARPYIPDIDIKTWDKLKNSSHYQQLDINNQEDFKTLHLLIKTIEEKNKLHGNRLLYCAVPSTLYGPLTLHAKKATIITCKETPEKKWQRIVYEKPFGHDYQSAKKLNEDIHHCLKEEQIYRIDHYLAKELVSNITLVRFTNRLFEPQWNARDIESVHITLNEALDVAERGSYYDRYGILKDVVQNHIFELIALICMERPTTLTGSDIQQKRAEVLKDIHFKRGILGQYEGYQQVAGVTPNSTTPTYAALTFFIDNKRWHGVPFFVQAGKCLEKTEKMITITFKPETCRLTHGCPLPKNKLTIAISPNAGFSVELNIKQPQHALAVTPVKMEFCHECLFGVYTPEAYEIVLTDVINGEQGISVRFDEIEASWKIVDTIEKAQLPVLSYQCGSTGPDHHKEKEIK